ncbi:lysine-specific demethylase JMJ30 [Nymphaea colorata]|nr:lysine-specific demethylase JMJ30 [Nymphaea colorata]
MEAEGLANRALNAEGAGLLRKIADGGGFAFVAVAERAESGDAGAAETAQEMAWEQLHSGPWHAVEPVWRDAYSLSCLHLARIRYASGDIRAALRVLDLGLLMGGSLLRSDLDDSVSVLSKLPAAAGATAAGDSNRSPSPSPGREDAADDGGSPACADFADVLQVLPAGSLCRKQITRTNALSLEGFLCDYFLTETPVVMSGCIDHWPASTKWKDMKYLRSVAGDRTIPVEVGDNYLAPGWKQELITFNQLLERIQANGNNSSGPTYLAQHPLFDQISELRKDIIIPDYCTATGGDLKSVNAWFGPSGTVTPLHQDPHHNLFAQVVGKKYMRLYPSKISEELYPFEESMLSNSSKVDLDNPDFAEFSKAENLDFTDCILEEGEMLYIPPKWWHYVRSLSTSFSVSFWWSENNPTNFESDQ